MALTFDDAPGVYDDELVAALHELRVPATFFAVGSYALHTGSIGLTRLLAAGHQVGFHSFSHVKLKHPVPTGATFYDHEIDDTEAAFRQLLGGAELPRYIRPVGLHLDEPVAYELRRRGYEVVMGTINLKDWSGVPPSDMLAALRASVRRTGAAASHIVVLHVGLNATIPWLHAAVPRMRRLGFRFVRVDECLGYPDRPRQTTKI